MSEKEGPKNKIYLEWGWFGQLTEELVKKVRESGEQFDGVFGIPRGGAPLATRLSHALGDLPLLMHPRSSSLIADDISDEGRTLERYVSKYEHREGRPKMACLFSTPWTQMVPDWYVAEKKNPNDWIEFPWERSEQESREHAEQMGMNFLLYQDYAAVEVGRKTA